MNVNSLLLYTMGGYLALRSAGYGIKLVEEFATGSKIESDTFFIKDANHVGVDIPTLFSGAAMVLAAGKEG